MTFVHVAIMVAVLLAAMVASMLYYGSRGKKKMGEMLQAAARHLGGETTQKSRMHYPHLVATVDGRPVEVFFHLSEGHRKTSDIVYLVATTPTRLPAATLAVQEGYFTKAPDKGPFNAVAGDYLAGLMPGRYVYGTDEAHSMSLFENSGVAPFLAALERYPNVVLGPDAITLGKPYGGPRDLEAARLEQDLHRLTGLAAHLEARASGDAQTPAASSEGNTANAFSGA
ncbi:MAG: hypothetical protein OEW11_02755 [Nitrospirota bacterium]|nr:hypothetical protein [Nitrospirota bacterium]